MTKPDKLNLKQWAAEDRPREKMKQKGAGALTNAELLAILIHTGNTEDSVVALTQKVMASCRNSLSELGKLSVGGLCSFKVRPRQLRSWPHVNWADAARRKLLCVSL